MSLTENIEKQLGENGFETALGWNSPEILECNGDSVKIPRPKKIEPKDIINGDIKPIIIWVER